MMCRDIFSQACRAIVAYKIGSSTQHVFAHTVCAKSRWEEGVILFYKMVYSMQCDLTHMVHAKAHCAEDPILFYKMAYSVRVQGPNRITPQAEPVLGHAMHTLHIQRVCRRL